ncbi:MAG TPA: pantoate--beta-alanine ligase [Polyangiaceae bacterium]|nr:pantoate--beta-alanine ligase [Polyangiaceae bacterium]
MRPQLFTTLAEYRAACDALRREGHRLGLVPTLGALHHAHQALMRAARQGGEGQAADRVAVTLFVNPTQFGPNEDFKRYPRDLEGDLAACEAAGVDLVFAPELGEIYPPGEATRVRVSGLTDNWCGKSRPGHFEGVATVVTKLFAASGPCVAVFGRKDYQQLQVVKRLTTDLLLPVQIIEHPTQRDPDGLAASSRNRYLSPSERARALALPRALAAVGAAFQAGERRAERLAESLGHSLRGAEIELEYAALVDSRDLTPLVSGELAPAQGAVLLAARVGSTRLIDNTVLGVDVPPPVGAGTAA